MKSIFTDTFWFTGPDTDGYGAQPIPHALDNVISRLLDRWQQLEPKERLAHASAITEKQRIVLLAYSERMASQAVRSRDPEDLFRGLLAMGIDGWRTDSRENMLLLSLYNDACERLGLSIKAIFAKVSKLLPLNVSTSLNAFLNRHPQDKSLDAMGYEASSDADGFRYKRVW